MGLLSVRTTRDDLCYRVRSIRQPCHRDTALSSLLLHRNVKGQITLDTNHTVLVIGLSDNLTHFHLNGNGRRARERIMIRTRTKAKNGIQETRELIKRGPRGIKKIVYGTHTSRREYMRREWIIIGS